MYAITMQAVRAQKRLDGDIKVRGSDVRKSAILSPMPPEVATVLLASRQGCGRSYCRRLRECRAKRDDFGRSSPAKLEICFRGCWQRGRPCKQT